MMPRSVFELSEKLKKVRVKVMETKGEFRREQERLIELAKRASSAVSDDSESSDSSASQAQVS
jgi:hypothetical protein